jgi:hypothetical protein
MLAAIALACGGFYHRATLKGIYSYKFANWEEEDFIGKPWVELEDALLARKERPDRAAGDTLELRTGRNLLGSETAFQFEHGNGYPWFGLGTAHNLGYVIITNRAGQEMIVEVIRFLEVDSL